MKSDELKQLRLRNDELEARLAEAIDALEAIRAGEVDALLVSRPEGDRIYTLESADSAYRMLVENMREGAVNVLEDGSILYCNQRFAEMVGAPLERVIGTNISRYVNPRDSGILDALMMECGRGRNAGEIALTSVDGNSIPTNVSMTVLDLASVQTYCMIVTDLSVQKRNEKIAADERLARAILDQAAECIVVCDKKGRIMRVSQEVGRFYYGNPLLQPFDFIFQLKIAGKDEKLSCAPALAGKRIVNQEVTLDRGDTVFTMLINAGPLLDTEHKTLGCVITLTDISDRHRDREALIRSEERYRELVQNANSAIVRWRRDGTVIFFNEFAQKFFGYTVNEIVGKPVSMLVPEQESSGRDLSSLTQDIVDHPEKYQNNVNENIRRDGRRVWMAWANKPVYDENNNAVEILAVGTDITRQKQIEDELKELNRTLEDRIQERTVKLKDTVRQLQILAHQLTQAEEQERGRLAEILHNDIQQLLVACKMHMSRINNAVPPAKFAEAKKDVINLVDEAITKTRNLSHELSPPMFSRQNISAALNWLCLQMKTKHELNVRMVSEPEIVLPEPLKVFLFRAAQELLFNVVKHAHVNEAEIDIAQIDRTVLLTVIDRGRGFDPAQIGRSGQKGTGYGLFSIQERIELLGGRMAIDSAPGQGSRFTIHLPIDALSPQPN